MNRDEVRVRGKNLDERDECDVPHCVVGQPRHNDMIQGLTVLIDILQESSQLFDAGRRERFSFSSVEHSSDDRRLNAFVE